MRQYFAALAALLFASGCGGNTFTTGTAATSSDAGGDGAVVTTLTADKACEDSASARCLKIQQCSQSLLETTYVSEGTCATRYKLACLNALSAPATGNTPAAFEACAAAMNGASCDDFLDDHPPPACAQQTGPRASGKACSIPAQCQTGFCDIAPGSPCGVCAPPPNAGDPCANITTCGLLLTCVSGVSTCAAFAASGAACGRSQPCGAGLSCVGATTTASGTCLTAVESLGLVCDPQTKTGPGCDRNALLTCNSTSRSCATIQVVGAGQPCGTVNDQLALCGAAGTCVTTATTMSDGGATDAGVVTTSTCVAAATDGEPCDLVAGPFCEIPARCISADGGTTGTCAFEDPTKCP